MDQSKPGKNRVSSDRNAPPPWVAAAGGNESGGGTILVVEDDPMTRLIFKTALSTAGFDVCEAEDGMQALELFREQGDDILGVVLDLVLPRLDGFETFHELRRLRPGLPVLVASGLDPVGVLSLFRDRRYLSYLRKTIAPEKLIHWMRELTDAAVRNPVDTGAHCSRSIISGRWDDP
ncbi:MAG: response regulator [bacterium]|nr:response regulator [bacterium]